MLEIPLNSSPEQLFSIPLEGETYNCRVVLNSRSGVWAIDFSQNNTDIVVGVALVGGVDILNQYNIPITNMFIVNLDNSALDASKDGLGTISKLFILTDEEISGV
tara:strand:+ start:23531 stop:23845 length:315 start_codon:yes stop_codon:yes gene_type:complete